MNIIVDFNAPIKDGTAVVFRSPVDCSKVTGLIVKYPANGRTASKEFSFADAHGNNVGDIDHLFTENVVVKVILDVTNSMAYVQNADTNAYLEGRFDDIIDKLCPSFEKTGTVVQCEPLEGTVLTITDVGSIIGVTTVTVCGKNLYNPAPKNEGGYPLIDGYWINKGSGAVSGEGKHADYCATADAIPVSHLRGQYITLNHRPGGSAPGMAFYGQSGAYLGSTEGGDGGKGLNVQVPEDAWFMRFTTLKADKDSVQIEIGSAPTDFEPYTQRQISFTAYNTLPGKIEAFKGVNTIFAYDDVGNYPGEATTVTFTGKADPVAIIDKLTKAVLSLGGNV